MGLVERAAIGDDIGGVGHLQRGREHITLANAHVVRVALEPRLVLVKLLPRLIGNGAVRLTADIHPGARAVAESPRILGEPIDAQTLEDRFGALLVATAEPEEIDI